MDSNLIDNFLPWKSLMPFPEKISSPTCRVSLRSKYGGIHPFISLCCHFFPSWCSVFPPFSFSLMNACPGDSCSWPCLHQVRCIAFYFVFHQLWLHKTPLVSGDCCQQLQSPLLVGSFACVPPNPVYSPACWQPLDETRGQWRPRRGAPDCCQWPLWLWQAAPLWVSFPHV